ncbi:hypothetical protein TL16_g06039 [Triparma laevis f. inornata]|nr:hypothetical protein TL16_g06039 [Triparma laevis f. inornata]
MLNHGGPSGSIKTLSDAKAAWPPIFSKWNLTKVGLIKEGWKFDSKEYDTFVREGPSAFIKPDPVLRKTLLSLPQKKVLFTNSPEESATECLELLGVRDLFTGILGTDFQNNLHCKPSPQSFLNVLEFLGIEKGEEWKIAYFEDSFKNMLQGHRMGMKTIFVESETLGKEGRGREELSQFDVVLTNVGSELKETCPDLWRGYTIHEVGFWGPVSDLPLVTDYINNSEYDEVTESMIMRLRPSPDNDTIVHSYELGEHDSRVDGEKLGCTNLMIRRGKVIYMFPESLYYYVTKHNVRIGGESFKGFEEVLKEECGGRETLMMWDEELGEEVEIEGREAIEGFLEDRSKVYTDFQKTSDVKTCWLL